MGIPPTYLIDEFCILLMDLLDGGREREGPMTSGLNIGVNSEIPLPEAINITCILSEAGNRIGYRI